MTKLSIKIDVSQLVGKAAELELAGASAPTAIARALNHTGAKARTAVARALAAKVGLGVRMVQAQLRTQKATRDNLAYAIIATGSPLPLRLFSPVQDDSGVTSKAFGGRAFAHAFISAKLGGNVFMRGQYGTDDDGNKQVEFATPRLPINKVLGPSIPKELVSETSAQALQAVVDQDFSPRLHYEIERILARRSSTPNG